MYGWVMVCPKPIATGASIYASPRISVGDELFARNPPHRFEHALIVNTALQKVLPDHLFDTAAHLTRFRYWKSTPNRPLAERTAMADQRLLKSH